MDPEEQEVGAETAIESGEVVAEQSEAIETQTNGQPADNNESVNPAWEEILKDIPEGYKGIVTPVLKKWDQQVNEKFQQRAEEIRQAQEQLQRFKPYEQFVNQGVHPQQIAAAQVLLQEMNRDPKAFYQKLGEHYGFVNTNDPQQAQDDDDVFDPNAIDPAVAKQLQEVQQGQQAIQEFMQQQAQAQIQAQAKAQVDAEFDSVVEKYSLNDIDKKEVLRRAVLITQQNPEAPDVFEAAFREWDSVKRAMFAQTNSRQAPSVVNPGGSSPITPPKKFSDMSDSEFKADTVAALQAALQQR